MFDIEKYKRSLDAVHAPEDTLSKVYERLGKRGKVRKISRIGLLAAILVPLFVATALATGISSMTLRKLDEDETEPVSITSLQPDGSERTSVYDIPTDIVLEFTYEGDAKEVYFKPGWLPGEDTPEFVDEQGYKYLIWGTEGATEGDIMFLIDIYPGSMVNGTKYVFEHKGAEVVRQEKWLDWQRVDVNQKFIAPDGRAHDDNFIMLFSEEYGYLLTVAGDQDAGSDFEVLEKIAENLTMIVTDEPAPDLGPNSNFSVITLGWG